MRHDVGSARTWSVGVVQGASPAADADSSRPSRSSLIGKSCRRLKPEVSTRAHRDGASLADVPLILIYRSPRWRHIDEAINPSFFYRTILSISLWRIDVDNVRVQIVVPLATWQDAGTGSDIFFLERKRERERGRTRSTIETFNCESHEISSIISEHRFLNPAGFRVRLSRAIIRADSSAYDSTRAR